MLVVNWSTSFSCLFGCIEMLSIQLTVCQMMRSPGHVVPVFPLRIIIFGSVSHVWPRSFRDGDICHMDCLTMLKLGGDSTWDLGWKYQMGVFFRQEYPFSTADGSPQDQLQRVLCFSKNFCWYKLLNNKNQIVTAVFSIQCFIHVLIGRSNGRIWAWASACSFVWIFGSLFYISPFEKNIDKWTRS